MRVPLADAVPDDDTTQSMSNLFGSSNPSGSVAQGTPSSSATEPMPVIHLAKVATAKAVPAPSSTQQTMMGVPEPVQFHEEAVVEAHATVMGVVKAKPAPRTKPARASRSTSATKSLAPATWLPWVLVAALLLVGIPIVGWLLLRENPGEVSAQATNPALLAKTSSVRMGKHAAIEISSGNVRLVAVEVLVTEEGEVDYDLPPDRKREVIVQRPDDSKYAAEKKGYLDRVTEVVKELSSQATSEWGVDHSRLYIIADGSSVGTPEQTADLKQAVEKTSRSLRVLSSNEAIELNFLGIVPSRLREDGVLVDMGNSALRLGCYRNGNFIPYVHLDAKKDKLGLKQFVSLVKKNRETADADTLLSAAEDEKVGYLQAVRQHLDSAPVFRQKKHIYLLGGIPWSLAVLSRPASCTNAFQFSLADINSFTTVAKQVALDVKAFQASALQLVKKKVTDPEAVLKIEKQLKDVEELFVKPADKYRILISVPYVYECLDILDYHGHTVEFFPESHFHLAVGHILQVAKVKQR